MTIIQALQEKTGKSPETPEIERCEVKLKGNILQYFTVDGCHWSLSYAINKPNFIGFLSEGWLHGRQYKHKKSGGIKETVLLAEIDDYEILTPTHVLFREGK